MFAFLFILAFWLIFAFRLAFTFVLVFVFSGPVPPRLTDKARFPCKVPWNVPCVAVDKVPRVRCAKLLAKLRVLESHGAAVSRVELPMAKTTRGRREIGVIELIVTGDIDADPAAAPVVVAPQCGTDKEPYPKADGRGTENVSRRVPIEWRVSRPWPPSATKKRSFSRVSSAQTVESIRSASAIGTSYSNSGRTIPVRGPLMATVAMSSDIRTRTLRPWYAAIKPSRMLTLRTADCLQSSLATKNFRSISTGPWCSCSFGRSDFSRTDTHVLIEVLLEAVVYLADARTCAVFASFFKRAQISQAATA
jgi:hypothetical protein